MSASEIARRRTFAIISHPDAGKTTLTEKFLLYGGAVDVAGSVRARRNQRNTTSDWMELERQRGISISSTVLQFDYAGYRINLLDTPGHQDFSEDTYRVLMAVDSVIMVLDAGAGVESQTRKLFEVCRQRGIPIFTFVNKMDRPALEPLALLDQLQNVLQMETFPINWPLGNGPSFRGTFDRLKGEACFFERTAGGAHRSTVSAHKLSEPAVRRELQENVYHQVVEELELLEVLGITFDPQRVLSGQVTPVLFGSAVHNFGIEQLLDYFLSYAPGPQARPSRGRTIPPEHPHFSGFIFKIQANLDPRHRDRIAFLRVCSGRFARDMQAVHVRTGRKLRLSNSRKVFGRERDILDEAFPGDIVGLVGQSDFQIGDTIADDDSISYDEIPRFSPECFAYLRPAGGASAKSFRKGLDQLLQEGVVQALYLKDAAQRVPLLAAVGPLQFDVVRYRLQSEYGVDSEMQMGAWQAARWPVLENGDGRLGDAVWPRGATLALDEEQRPVILFLDEWSSRYFQEKNPELKLSPVPPSTTSLQPSFS